MFTIYGYIKGGFVSICVRKTKEEAIATAQALIGQYDVLQIKDTEGSIVWELPDARRAPKASV